jgi:hypothetical protein
MQTTTTSTTAGRGQASAAALDLQNNHSGIAPQQENRPAGLRQQFVRWCGDQVLALVASRPRLYGLLMALRTFRWRMEVERRLHEGRLAVDFGPAGERLASGCIVPCRRTHVRIQDARSFSSTLGEASLYERWVFLQGWNRGEQFALCKLDTPRTDAERQP